MATVSGTFTATGVSSSLQLQAAVENVTVSLSGTYSATVQLERSLTPDQTSWERVLGPWSTDNATVSVIYRVDRANETFRLQCTVFGSGTVTYSISDAAEIVQEFADDLGTVHLTVDQDGVNFPTHDGSSTGLKLNGTLLTASASELNALDGITSNVSELNILDGVTSTAAELNLLDGSSATAPTASTAAILDSGGDIRTASNVGTANTGVTAVEYGDGYNHTTVLTVSQVDALTLADLAAIAAGYLLYTFPAGTVVVNSAYMTMAVTAGSPQLQADTPDVGLGTVIASGAVSVLGGTATFENIITGQTAADTNGTATVKTATPTAGVPLVIESGDAHTVHFNVADSWADDTSADLTADIAGTVVLHWTFLA